MVGILVAFAVPSFGRVSEQSHVDMAAQYLRSVWSAQRIYWLENQGSFPFKAHKIAGMYGCYRAVAADFEGNGRNDIVAVSNIPSEVETNTAALRLNSVLFVQNLGSGQFKEYPLEQGSCYYFTCVAGEVLKVDPPR